MSITAASLIATVSLVGADQAATQLLGVGTSADLAQTSLLSTSAAAASAAPALAGLASIADADTVALSGITSIADANTVSLAGLTAAVDADATAYYNAIAAYDASTASLTANSAVTDKAALAADKASAAALKNAKSFDVMGAASSAASGALDILGKAGSFVFDALKKGAEAITVVGVASTFLAGKFQQEMTKLYTTAGELHSNLKMVGSGILDMAGQVGTGALKLGDAMYWIESGGAHGAAGLTDLKIAAEGAKAENSNLDDVAKALMGTLNAFKGTGLSAATAMNVLVASTANGMMTLQDLSNAMSNVSPAAAKFGISVVDIGAGLATMTAQGDNAEQAATHLRQVILALESPAKAGAKAIKEIGLTTQQVSDAMRKSLPDAIEMITTDLGKKFPEGSTAYNNAIKDIAGGNKQLLALLETSGASMKTYKDNVKNISEAVKQGGKDVMGWADVQANFNTIMDEAGAAIESLFIKIGTALLPALSQLFQKVGPTISAFSTWIDKSGVLSGLTQTLSDGVGKLGEAFNYIADAFDQVFNRGNNLIDTFDHATAVIKPLQPVMKTLTDTFDRASGVMDKLNPVMKPVLDTFDRATSVFDHTAGAVRGVDQAAQGAPNSWIPFWAFVKNVIADVKRIDWAGIGAGLERIRVAISHMDWGKVGAFFSGIATSISKVDWGKVGKDIEKIATGLTKVDWGKVAAALSGIINSLLKVDWDKTATNIKKTMDELSTVDWKSTIQGFTDLINGIRDIVNAFQWMSDVLLGGVIGKFISGIIQWFVHLADKLTGHSIIPDLVNDIVKWFASLPGKLKTLITTLVSDIASWWGDLPGKIGAFAGSIISKLVAPFQSAQNTISGIVSTIGGWISNLLGQIGSVGPAAAHARPPGFASGIENFGGGLAYVHAGEVLTYLPPGTSVTPANKVSAMGGGSAPVIHNHIDVYLDGQRMTGQLMPRIVQSIRTATGARI